jgi:hypothetical protein
LEADLIERGLRLRDCPTPGFNWRDLHVIVRHARVDSNLYREIFPEAAGWNLTNQLLAAAVDIGIWFKWVRLGHEGDAPDRISRPGVVNDPKMRKRGTPMRLSEAKKVYAEVGPVSASKDPEAENLRKLKAIFGNGG